MTGSPKRAFGPGAAVALVGAGFIVCAVLVVVVSLMAASADPAGIGVIAWVGVFLAPALGLLGVVTLVVAGIIGVVGMVRRP